MSFLKNLFKPKTEKAIDRYDEVATMYNEEKVTSITPKIDMSKHEENLGKVLINMSKDKKIDMSKHIARVGMVLDYSGSMDGDYTNGSVQDTITRLLPLALKFDDNGELESWIFSSEEEQLRAVTINNYETYVDKIIGRSKISMSGTYYAPVLQDVIHYYKDIEPSTIPSFVIFITDGDTFDENATNKVIRELSNYNIFIQFIGIGAGSHFTYLRKLDNLKGRQHDNTGFIAVEDMNAMSDQELYAELLRQYVDWLNNKQ